MSFNPQTHYQDDRIATRYDAERFSSLAGRVFQSVELATLKRAIGYLPPKSSLLDVPCGTGRIASPLTDWGFTVTCADISLEMLQVARDRLRQNGSGRFS